MKDQNALHSTATNEFVEAVKETASARLGVNVDAKDITGLTPAQISEYLFAKVLDGEVIATDVKYIMTSIFAEGLERLGRKEFKYSVNPGTSDDLDIQSENTIEDFNGEYVDLYAEVMETTEKFHKKVKLPELVLSDAWLAAEKMTEFVQVQVREMDRAQIKDMENFTWAVTNKEHVAYDLPGSDMEGVLKKVTQVVKEYATTSKKHFAVGTDGVDTLSTVKGDVDYQPENRFEGSEFVLMVNTSDFVNYEWDTLAKVFNMSVQDVKPEQVINFEFDKYSGFDAILKPDGTEKRKAVALPDNTKAILIHKGWLRLLDKFVYTQVLKGRGPWSIQHFHKEFGAYRVKGLPKPIYFTASPKAPAPKTKSAPKAKSTAK